MDFIFMLTREDRTVPDCLEILEQIRPLGLAHVGFKDVGCDSSTLRRLAAGIRAMGAISWLEVVSTSADAVRASILAAAELGVDRVLGGREPAFALKVLQGTGARYLPFAGHPRGHPTLLGGTAEDVAAHCREAMAAGCAGVDLLAYRAVEAEPLDLVRAARGALGNGHLVVAGSIDSPQRIADIARAGADAFTIGTAAFDNLFPPGRPILAERLADIVAATRAV